jgi:choline-glycine betaine transporter
MTKEEPPPRAEGIPLSLGMCGVLVWSIWILAFLAGAFSHDSPLYVSLTLVAALGTIAGVCWDHVKRRREPS